MKLIKSLGWCALALLVVVKSATSTTNAGTIFVPNASFESPETPFVDLTFDAWQKSTLPDGYPAEAQAQFYQLTGVFLNTEVGATNHIDNVEGRQAAYLFAIPGVALFQDYNTKGAFDLTPSHNFNTKFEVGRSYQLTVAAVGGGGGMTNDATMEISLYYRDAASNLVTVAATSITNSTSAFPNQNHFTDYQVVVPAVKPGDPWAGQNIGIQLLSTVRPELQGGYWDVDNVRLIDTIPVPNASFELPSTVFVDLAIDSWQKSTLPDGYPAEAQAQYYQLTGAFLNTEPGATNHIDNVDARQAAYLFAIPGVALFQDVNTIGGTNITPSHDFNAKFAADKSYVLNVAVVGGGGGMTNGATMQLSLYYRDGSNNMVTVAATSITNTSAAFPTQTHFTDYQVVVPVVKATDPWAGQNIGIQLLSTVPPDLQGGYWDVDNVRITETRATILQGFDSDGSETQFALQSEPGMKFEILGAESLPAVSWANLLTITNTTGRKVFSVTLPYSSQRFYQARQLP